MRVKKPAAALTRFTNAEHTLMDTSKLQEILGSLSGHLAADTPEQEREVSRLQQMLSRSLLSEEAGELKATNFSFEGADLFDVANIPAVRAESVRAVAEGRAESVEEPEFRVFVREVPVRSTQLRGSTPLWAAGSAIERTLGPFTHADGRVFWFDFIRIDRLIALYVQGSAEPALLFKVTRFRFIDGFMRPEFEQTSYNLSGASVWINSRLLAADAPANNFTGIAINGGTVTLSAPPQTVSGKLTVANSTRVSVELQPRQPAVTDTDESSPYGVDAREASLRLPERFAFRFTGAVGEIQEVGTASWNVYGHEATFDRRQQSAAPRYDEQTHRVLIPLECSEQQFEVRNSRSRFNTLRGAADIHLSAWALPAAPIDVANPTPAAGAGALLVRCAGGLTSAWQKLDGGEFRLTNPYVLAEPGRISVTDLKAAGGLARQDFKLWTDEQNMHGTTVRVLYPQETLFFYFTLADGGEVLIALCDADFRVDRPVTVTGEPPAVRSKKSLIMLALDQTKRIIYLFDDNILLDNLDLKKKYAPPKPLAFALKNALFKVTPANGCLLFGRLDEELTKVERGWLYLTFGMYAYLPTLPDPYAANIGFLSFQFRGRGNDLRTSSVLAGGGTPWLWLVCLVKWTGTPAPDVVDDVTVSFHFAPLQNQFQSVPWGDFASDTSSLEFTSDTPDTSDSIRAASGTTRAPQFDTANVGNAARADEARTDATFASRIDSAFEPRAASVGGELPDDVSLRANAFAFQSHEKELPDYGAQWDDRTRSLQQESFALLDVSTKADLFGVSFGANLFGDRRFKLLTTHQPDDDDTTGAQDASAALPIQIAGLDVVSRGAHVRAFTVPQISWEPVYNLTAPGPAPGDPAEGFNYYPDDGGPTRIVNNGAERVALAPIPVTRYLVDSFADEKFFALATFGLPFGMKALALLKNKYTVREGTRVSFNAKHFKNDVATGRRLKVEAGDPQIAGQGKMFVGSTVQLNNLLSMGGAPTGDSTLGGDVTEMFNQEFFEGAALQERGVPLTRIDLSGYGASIFSNWLNLKAPIASTSQARFDVFVGRCAHEIIQVESILYPWAIKVVRTITLRRTASGYVFRHDSGWKSESDGLFDFTHFAYRNTGTEPFPTDEIPSPYEIHRGLISGLFQIRDIRETTDVEPFEGAMTIKPLAKYVDSEGFVVTNGNSNHSITYKLRPVYFTADVEIENPVSGFAEVEVKGKKKIIVASKGILGFVQIRPLGQPLTPEALALLIARQGTIGGPIDCLLDVAKSGQQMRVNRFDVSNSFGADGVSPAFAATARGNVLLPKDGAWSLVRHEHSSGDVSPVPKELSVPLIRAGMVKRVGDVVQLDRDPKDELARVAEPAELLRPPTAGSAATPGTVNYGFLHTTDTQKALFLNPSFKHEAKFLFSKTPPLFADAFRIASSKAIFPKAGNAVSNFGDAISLVRSGTEFDKITAGGQQVFRLMDVGKIADEQGYKLLKQDKSQPFQLPDTWELIKVGTFRIYIEYKADNVERPGQPNASLKGGLDFDVDSFTNDVSKRWKSHMSNVAIVVDLGPIPRLMTIKGNWDAKKGSEASYGGSASGDHVPSPQIEFAGVLEPAMQILEILEKLQGGDYAGAFGSGVRLAMSNKAGTWEYKFEASKEIPVIRFPPIAAVYNDPNTPLKLEAGLRLGAYFNAALKVQTNDNQLLPTAGGFFGFYGRLSVMCVSLSVGTIYAIGQVNLDIAADTKSGPSLRMKFGFGAQIVVGLPVVGNVSVLYVVGVEIFLGATVVEVSAFMLFQGHAELLGGLVSVTITIEAKGTVREDTANNRTDLAAQVTFGLDISIFLIINISFSETWGESRQIA